MARLNCEFSKRGVRYHRKAEITTPARRYFKTVEFVEDRYLKHCPGRSHSLYLLVGVLPSLKALFAALHTRVLLLRK